MATTRTFSAMLNDYVSMELLREEFMKRNFLYNKIEKDEGWVGAVGSSTNGGSLIVPFQGAQASSIAYGELVATTNVAEDAYVRGLVTTQKEAWGTMQFNGRDLMEHNKVSDKNFLKILPDALNAFMDLMTMTVSVNLLNGPQIATLTADGDASGNITVDHPDRFQIGQEVFLQDGNSALSSAAYVNNSGTGININTSVINLVTARGGATPFDASSYTVSQTARVYIRGGSTLAFQSLRNALLSSANGGDSTLHNVTKTTYPYLQAININGGSTGVNPLSVTAVNILEKIFDGLTTIRRLGKGKPTDVIMSYKNLGSCLKILEGGKGSYNVVPGSQKTMLYSWTQITVGSVAYGGLNLVGVQECDDDIIFFMDWNALKFYSNGGFKRNVSPDGLEYFTARASTGYTYYIDHCLFGELVVTRPSSLGIMFGISY